MSLAILFHFLCARHVSDINIFIIRSLRLFCWIGRIFFRSLCVGVSVWLGWSGIRVAGWRLLFYFTSYVLDMFRTLIYPSSGACDYSVDYHIGRIVLGSMCVGVSVWLGWSGIRVAGWSCASACNTDTTPTHPPPKKYISKSITSFTQFLSSSSFGSRLAIRCQIRVTDGAAKETYKSSLRDL